MNNKRLIKESILCMVKCSIGATLLNLATWVFGMGLYIILYNLLAYILLGTPVFYICRKKSWKIQTIAVWGIVNTVSLVVLIYILLKPANDPGPHCLSPLVLFLPIVFLFTGILSIIPVGYFCRKAQEKIKSPV